MARSCLDDPPRPGRVRRLPQWIARLSTNGQWRLLLWSEMVSRLSDSWRRPLAQKAKRHDATMPPWWLRLPPLCIHQMPSAAYPVAFGLVPAALRAAGLPR
ncbi:hypothetical protein PSNTI_40400 [Stutzerimonas stutzeri]|nr:hypothetical protein PSNTI_40400 [Stutzerimonas stutzeri]